MNKIAHEDFFGAGINPVGKGFVQSVTTSHLPQKDINAIYKIEQDMWAHGLGEYIRCEDCGNIDGKYDVYTHETHASTLLKKTVSEIEDILHINSLCCSKCGGKAKHIFGEWYRDEIGSRYQFLQSYLSVYRDHVGQIRGFMDGYVADFDTIFSREFEHYYGEDSERIKNRIAEIVGANSIDGQKFICITALGTDEEHGNMFIIYALLKQFFSTLLSAQGNIAGIYESVLGTNTHAIYQVCGGKRIDVSTLLASHPKNTHDGYQSDIFVHPNIAERSLKTLNTSLKNFLIANKKEMQQIVDKSPR